MIETIRRAGDSWGWLLAVVVAVAALVIVYTDAPSQTPIGSIQPERTTPYAPGDNFDVLAFCEDTETKGGYGIPPHEGGNTLQLKRRLELVEWKDTLPLGSNPAAGLFWIDEGGAQQFMAVEMTQPAAECTYAKAGTPR